MSKNILILNGSPKKDGNTSQLVEWFTKGARSKDVSIEIIRAASLKSKSNGCLSCRTCQRLKEFGCVIHDDIKEVLEKMAKADAIVFATPLYFYGPSAQLKLIIDRMFSLYKWDNTKNTFETPLRGKSMFLLLSAYEDIGLDIVEKSFKLIADYSDMKFRSLLVPNARESGEIHKLKGIRKRVVEFGRSVKTKHAD